MVNDPIADMITRIKNANQRKHEIVNMPSSKVKVAIAKILKEEGFINDYKEVKIDNVKKSITLTLKYKQNLRVISGLRRISKPGLRVYFESEKLPKVLNGFGIAIVSTSKGIMTDKKARAKHLGGEIMAYVW